MKVAVMQPYFLPYIGYFQLIAAVDLFIIYDKIKYTKKGWVNRNRYLVDGAPSVFTIPVAQGPDALDIRDRTVATAFDREKLIRRVRSAYHRAPHRERGMELFERCVRYPDPNLFGFLDHSIRATSAALSIRTPVIVSSTLDIDPTLTAQDKVIALCKAVGASAYLNPIGGRALYDAATFASHGLSLSFLEARAVPYAQTSTPFVPFLSILDVLMFNDAGSARALLDAWDET
jgi:hypothetical protein